MGQQQTTYSVIRKVQPPGYAFQTAAYDQAQLICVTEGELWCREQGRKPPRAVRPGMFVLLRKNGAFALFCRGQGYAGIGVSMRPGPVAGLEGPMVVGMADSRLRLMMEMVFRHMDAPLPESEHILRGLGEALVWEVLALTRERSAPARRDWAAAARTALELNLGTGTPVRRALSSLPVSYRQVTRCFRERYGTSPKAYQELLRIDESRRMIVNTRMDITSIAVELGYSSSQHFASQFRRLVGCTPSQYRARGEP